MGQELVGEIPYGQTTFNESIAKDYRASCYEFAERNRYDFLVEGELSVCDSTTFQDITIVDHRC